MSARSRELIVLLGGRQVGVVERTGNRTQFTYDDVWRNDPKAYPLSLSMPLARAVHSGPEVDAYLWGLLPDNERVLRSWGKRFHVSSGNAFALLSHVGEDCPGAVQFVRASEDEGTGDAALARATIQWLVETDIAERLRSLREDPSATRSATDIGAFSLAGAQPKTALLFFDGRWGVPAGRIPTTHILKPPGSEFEELAENEHFCLTLARRTGLSAARSAVTWFAGEAAIVIERFDRTMAPGMKRAPEALRRVHQEDLCQALGVHPRDKYQSEGGPTPAQIVGLLRDESDSPALDTRRFVDALIFNWLIAGTDAHAKNYALLHGPGGAVRLAPLYDVISALPYPDQLSPWKTKLAMRIGSKYRVRDIRREHWESLADEARLPPDEVIDRVRDLARRVPDLAADVRRELEADGLPRDVVTRLSDGVAGHARECAERTGARRG